MASLSKSQFTRLQDQCEWLVSDLSQLSEELLRQKPATGKWSIFENVAHMGRYQETFEERVLLMLDSGKPEFARYVAADDQEFDRWLGKQIDELGVDFLKQRTAIIRLLSEMTSEQLSRQGRHPRLGWMNIVGWTEFFLLHEAHHLYTIFWLKAELKG